jgi:hypothetical protein
MVHLFTWYKYNNDQREPHRDVARVRWFSLINLVFRAVFIIAYISLIFCTGTDAFYLRATLTFAQFGYCILMGILGLTLKREWPEVSTHQNTINETEPQTKARPHPSYLFRSESKGRSKEHAI